jgi:hypothetical protein
VVDEIADNNGVRGRDHGNRLRRADARGGKCAQVDRLAIPERQRIALVEHNVHRPWHGVRRIGEHLGHLHKVALFVRMHAGYRLRRGARGDDSRGQPLENAQPAGRSVRRDSAALVA